MENGQTIQLNEQHNGSTSNGQYIIMDRYNG